MELNDATVVIVGGTSGIGFCVATMAGRAGARLVVTGRDPAKRERAVAELSAQGFVVAGHDVDAADEGAVQRFFEQVGEFDHLVSMAGGFMGGGFLEAPFATIRQAVDEKLFANLVIARCARPFLRAGGSMVFTAGSGGRPHTASGAIVGNDAIRTLVRGLAVELAPRGRANAVSPTWTRTPLWRHMAADQLEATDAYFAGIIPLGRTAKIEEVAAAYLFLMQNSFVTGQTVCVDGGVDLV